MISKPLTFSLSFFNRRSLALSRRRCKKETHDLLKEAVVRAGKGIPLQSFCEKRPEIRAGKDAEPQ